MEIVEFIDTGWILSKDAFLIYSDCMGKANYERYCELINIYLKDETCKVYGCLFENKFLGVMTLRLNGKCGEIMGIAVDKANRGKGIGSFLIDEVFKSESLEQLISETDDDAINFYKKCGFVTKKIIKQYPNGEYVRYKCVLHK